MDQGQHILQLIAEAEGAPGLVGRAARPEAAGQGLVHQPAVGQHVECRIGSFHLDHAKRVLPVLAHRFQCGARGNGATEALHEFAGVVTGAPDAKTKDDLALLPVG